MTRIEKDWTDMVNETIPKTCILCKHMWFDGGSPAYSEWTPGSNWSSSCNKKHWDLDIEDYISTYTYRDTLLTAQTCDDFERATFNLEEGKTP